jgi:hypothetical protein
LKSPRVPAGVLFFDSQHLGVSALIMVSLDPGNPKRYDQRIGDRLACDTSKPSPLGTESNGGAITRVFCDTSFCLEISGWPSLSRSQLTPATRISAGRSNS